MSWTPVQVVMCMPRTDGGESVAPCGPDKDGNASWPMVGQVYVPDQSSISAIEASFQPIDWTTNGEVFFAVWVLVLTCFVAGYVGREIIRSIR